MINKDGNGTLLESQVRNECLKNEILVKNSTCGCNKSILIQYIV